MLIRKFSRKKIHYGWIVCLCCTLVYMCTCGMPVSGFYPYMPFLEELGYQGSLLSSLVTIRCLTSFITLLFVAAFYKKVNLRTGLTVSCLIIAFASFLMSFANHFIYYAVGACLNGIGYGLGTIIPVSMLMTNWFSKRRTTAISVCVAGSALSNTFFPPLITGLATRNSLSTAFRVMCLIPCFVAVIVFILVRDCPSKKDLRPFGAETIVEESSCPSDTEKKHFTLSGWPFCLLCLGIALLGGFTMAASNHFSVLFTSFGYSKQSVALASSIEGIMLLLGKLLFGIIADKIGGKRTLVLFLLILLFGTVLGCFAYNNIFLMYIGLMLVGFGYPPSTIGAPVLAGDLASSQDYPRFLKNLQTCYTFGSIIISSLPGWFYDLTGSYLPGFAVLCCFLVMFLISILFGYRFHTRSVSRAV